MKSFYVGRILVVALMIITGTISVSAQSKYLGLKYESGQLPAGLESVGGRVVAETDEGLMDSLFLVNDLRPAGVQSYVPTMVWFEKTIEILEPDRSRVILEVLDVLELPLIEENQTYVPGGCLSNGVSDSQVFAIALDEDKEFYSKLLKVWRANVKTGKFEEISSKSVECENVGYGV